MSLTKIISDADAMKKKIVGDMQGFLAVYIGLEKEINKRFQEEYRASNNQLKGLEDFHMLSYISKKNLNSVKTACNLISRLGDISGFDIEEQDETIKAIEDILKD
jgi:thiamine monophosphate kinase